MVFPTVHSNGGRKCSFISWTSQLWTATFCTERPQGLGWHSWTTGLPWLEVATSDHTVNVNAIPPPLHPPPSPPPPNTLCGSLKGLFQSLFSTAERADCLVCSNRGVGQHHTTGIGVSCAMHPCAYTPALKSITCLKTMSRMCITKHTHTHTHTHTPVLGRWP